MADTEYDLAIIGAGPGGYVAAIRAAQLGMSVVIIEREHLGGICLNWGCIPTKALLRSAELFGTLSHLDLFGLTAERPNFDLEKLVKRSRAVADQLSKGVAHLLRKNKVDVILGDARFENGRTLRIGSPEGNRSLSAANIVIATGARPRQLPGANCDGKRILSSKEAMIPQSIPKSLLIVGSGAIGIEFASFYNAFGAAVTVIEVEDRILPVEDAEISAFARKRFETRGIECLTNVRLQAISPKTETIEAQLEIDQRVQVTEFDRAIIAVGITGNVEGLGLEELGIEIDRGHIKVGEYCQTQCDGVFAIGDVVGPPWLAHKASHEAVICVEGIAGNEVRPLDSTKIPSCTYCDPQIASVGLTEDAAVARGYDVRIGRFPFMGNGKALVLGESEGIVKTVFDQKTGELLGAHMAGPEVTELIQGYVIARQLEATELDLMETVFPHPTLSEVMHEAALDAYGRALHF